MRMPITPHKADPPTSDLYEPLSLFHRFPQFFRIPPLPQTLSLGQLEPHCVNPSTTRPPKPPAPSLHPYFLISSPCEFNSYLSSPHPRNARAETLLCTR